MMLWLYLKGAVQTIWSAKLRSFLTMLGIIIGVSMLLSLVSLGQGAKKQIVGQIDSLGADLVYAVSAKKYILSNFDTTTITREDIETIRQTPGVIDVAPVRYLVGAVVRGDKQTEPNLIVATTHNYQSIRRVSLDQGEFFQKGDDQEAANVTVIGPITKKILFGDSEAIGQSITFNTKNYKVVGVFKPADPDSELTIAGGFDNVMFLPLSTHEKQTKANQLLSVGIAKTAPGTDIVRLKSQIKDAILKNHDNTENFSVLSNDDLLRTSSTILDILSALILIITSGSILVGGIGIMNIMLVSVTERTKEIGIRKSMGATPGDILMQFLIESILMATTGGAIGIALSFLATGIASQYTGIRPVYSTGLIMLGFGVSFGVGLIFGMSPAIRAARKNPIDALHFE